MTSTCLYRWSQMFSVSRGDWSVECCFCGRLSLCMLPTSVWATAVGLQAHTFTFCANITSLLSPKALCALSVCSYVLAMFHLPVSVCNPVQWQKKEKKRKENHYKPPSSLAVCIWVQENIQMLLFSLEQTPCGTPFIQDETKCKMSVINLQLVGVWC